MLSSLRSLLVWLLALALPLQALAGATMLHCGPSHERMQTALPGTAVPASSAALHDDHAHAHDHGPGGEGALPEHHHEASASDLVPEQAAVAPDGASQPSQFTEAGQYKCSACASCCSASALLNSVPGVAVPDLSPTVFVAGVLTVEAFAADGPDRPPRIALT